MLEGIHILNKEVITDLYVPNEKLYVIMLAICVLSFVISLATLTSDNDFFGYIAIVCLISFIAVIILRFRGYEVETGRYKYEVTIDESVQFTDIYDRYEIIEQRGEIWVLEDKEK